ncbi:cell wall-associated hydrolase [Renibacterium salmoninarum ATCC 33209]|uniref:Cell wall-associated hydrolase n=1 Tax=Renibacterium salmoninarum (strain ATCC 33209 / DSM 20767 / JCM 11484 / NBRC 15589 / NCIMB 2235) TaxID=288705 RepID=A9WKY1_RENSM|nr:cell wall-associated hydrolase [Renibacterium salmoninarum ATCC 33209]
MSSKTSNGRHRAANVSVNPLNAISKAVASNAGNFGRQAAVVVVATGLVTSIGLPAQTAEAGRVSPEASDSIKIAAQTVTASKDANITFGQPSTSSAAKPALKIAAQSNTAAVSNTAQAKAPAEPAAEVPAISGGLAGVAAAAYGGIGVNYVWGGTSKAGWDCSGFTGWAFAQAGISLPRTNQWLSPLLVQTSTPQPGDLVVQNGGSHVAIYVGNGMEIGALNPSQGTQLTTVSAVGSATYYTMR